MKKKLKRFRDGLLAGISTMLIAAGGAIMLYYVGALMVACVDFFDNYYESWGFTRRQSSALAFFSFAATVFVPLIALGNAFYGSDYEDD